MNELNPEIITKTGQAIDAAGGGITGATAIVIVVAFLAVIFALFLIWSAYQKLLKDSKLREAQLIKLNLKAQDTQTETNEILKEVSRFMGSMDVRMQNLERQVEKKNKEVN